jgi:hypothetical protein
MNRNRFYYFLFILATIALGLSSRHYANYLPAWNKEYLGDALWALMVFFMAGFIFPQKSTMWIAVLALIFSFSIEFSQMYHAPWIDSIRNTRLGGLVLGYGFLWSDLICYCSGIGTGLLLEVFVLNNKRPFQKN